MNRGLEGGVVFSLRQIQGRIAQKPKATCYALKHRVLVAFSDNGNRVPRDLGEFQDILVASTLCDQPAAEACAATVQAAGWLSLQFP